MLIKKRANPLHFRLHVISALASVARHPISIRNKYGLGFSHDEKRNTFRLQNRI